MLKNIKKWAFETVAVFSLLILGGQAVAITPHQQSPENDGSIGVCDDGNNHATFINGFQPLEGTLYAQLANNSESPGLVTVYIQSLSDYQCQLVGQVNVDNKNWTPVASYKTRPGQTTAIVLSGDNLQAEPYAPVAKVMLAASGQDICDPVKCLVNYQGLTGQLQPKILSSATDEVAVYRIDSIDNLSTTRVDYYDDGTFIYTTKKLGIINRNYLPGGVRNITMNAFFTNNEELTVQKSVDMGPDYTYTLYLRSIYYRSHNKTVFVLAVLGIILTLAGLVWLIRYFFKRRAFTKNHGLDENHFRPTEDDNNPEDDIVIGG